MRLTRRTSGACTGSIDASRKNGWQCRATWCCRQTLTGVKAPIVVLFGRRFPMIGAHKVLAAYACLVPRLVTGQFDPSARPGGLAVHRQLLPRRRCDFAHPRLPRRGRAAGRHEPRALRLAAGVGCRSRPTSSARPGPRATSRKSTTNAPSSRATENNVILNQFSEFANYLIHYHCTGRAFDRVFSAPARHEHPDYRLAAFVSATGSAGTLARRRPPEIARTARKIAAVEAIECPTMLCNGYGEHNIQGIGDKHIPLIHNVMNTDVVVGVSDAGQRCAQSAVRRRMSVAVISAGGARSIRMWCDQFDDIGISGLANIVAADQARQASRIRRRRRRS